MRFSDYLGRGVLEEIFGVQDNYLLKRKEEKVNDDDIRRSISEPPKSDNA